MKKTAIISVVLLLAAAAWVVQIGSYLSAGAQQNAKINEAEQYCAAGLYQKAVNSYADALAIKESKKVREAWLAANTKAYEDGVFELGAYEDALELACDLYPKEATYWEKLLAFHIETNSFDEGYKALQKIKREKVTSDILTEQKNVIMYSFSTSRKNYSQFYRSPEGVYVVFDDKGWGVIDAAGERAVECDYQYISPYNQNMDAVYVSEKGTRLLNKEHVVEAIISQKIEKARACENGIIAVCDENGAWKYLDSKTGKYILDTYEDASSFVDGIAAVRKNGKWQLINVENELQCSAQFDDIKLHGNGSYAYQGVMVASVNGKYGVYDTEGKALCSAAYQDMDAYFGGYIAFKDSNGKWGFMNKKGEVVVQATYTDAKSFSNGLAAVSNGEMWGYINEDNIVVIDYQFFTADYFTKEGVTLVSNSENMHYLLKRRFV